MRAATKHILFTRVTVDKAVKQWPTAIFPNADAAKSFGSLLNMAHKTGNVELAVKLDAKTALDKEGKLAPGVKFSLLEVPYAPSLAAGDDDPFAEGNSSTA